LCALYRSCIYVCYVGKPYKICSTKSVIGSWSSGYHCIWDHYFSAYESLEKQRHIMDGCIEDLSKGSLCKNEQGKLSFKTGPCSDQKLFADSIYKLAYED